MTDDTTTTQLRLRLVFPEGRGMLGPGKADLLSLIRETGSIAAAGRRLGMSYKRAWSLVETLNAMFDKPVVTRSRGGSAHGGAQLTATGEKVLTLYQAVHAKALAAALRDIRALERLQVKAVGDMAQRR